MNSFCKFLIGVALASTFCSFPTRATERLTARDIHPERELLITAPFVLDSQAARYPGSWSFGALIEQLVGPEKASATVRDWLANWTTVIPINEQFVAPRLAILDKVIRPWQQRDGYDSSSGKAWEPNLAHAPFRLLAIVNRMDLCAPRVANTLRDVQNVWRLRGREADFLKLLGQASGGSSFSSISSYGTFSNNFADSSSAGEGRLVFGAIDSEGKPLSGDWTVIFEYRLPIAGTQTVNQWARQWHKIGKLDISSPEFAVRLEELTRSFTHRDNPARCSAQLAQLRSSEAAFGPDREFRQFNGQLAPDLLALTPAQPFAASHSPEQRSLLTFLHEQDALIRMGVHQLPRTLTDDRQPRPLLAGSAFIPASQPDFHWDRGPLVSRDARRIFSLSTCNGCHAGETGCRDGLHIHSRLEGSPARLSDFLRLDGKPHRLNDPDVRGSKIEYQEIRDRAAIFAALLQPKDRAMIEGLRPILRERLERTH